MAAGEFQKGIVGDSEKMLVAIASRAKLVPWEMCVLMIDEIDSIAPNRNDPSNEGKSSDLLGVFLSVLDGAKKTANLKIIASTNLRHKMDDAFMRRMEIQLFLGNPGFRSRM
jgi:SpoVK/Ycf46/Vps4 family AAA+-type ATPase